MNNIFFNSWDYFEITDLKNIPAEVLSIFYLQGDAFPLGRYGRSGFYLVISVSASVAVGGHYQYILYRRREMLEKES